MEQHEVEREHAVVVAVHRRPRAPLAVRLDKDLGAPKVRRHLRVKRRDATRLVAQGVQVGVGVVGAALGKRVWRDAQLAQRVMHDAPVHHRLVEVVVAEAVRHVDVERRQK
eukprot:161974-Chlamydomonas_euryale.AAC.1